MPDLAHLRARVTGLVQGVFFRAFVARNAREKGLTGYAGNMPDGSVEVEAEGERARLEELVELLRTGPPAARVEQVLVEWSDYSGKYRGFGIVPDYL